MRTLAIVLAVAMVATLMGCDSETAVDNSPKVSDMAAERKRIASKVKKRKGQKEKSAKVAKA